MPPKTNSNSKPPRKPRKAIVKVPEMKPPKKSEPKETKDDPKPPEVLWAKCPILTDKLVDAIEVDHAAKAAIWASPNDKYKTISLTRINACTQLLPRVFADVSPWQDYTEKYTGQPKRFGEKCLGKAVKSRLRILAGLYSKALAELDITGGGSKDEEELMQDQRFIDKWDIVKAMCPHFLRLRLLLGERQNVAGHTQANADEALDVDVLQRGYKETDDNDDEGGVAGDDEIEASLQEEEEEEKEKGKEVDSDNEPPIITVTEASPVKNKGKGKAKEETSK
ncbi:MAG: hypothetical protein Q9182_007678 [Xanthomendoza sp. 2 TL-2023]